MELANLPPSKRFFIAGGREALERAVQTNRVSRLMEVRNRSFCSLRSSAPASASAQGEGAGLVEGAGVPEGAAVPEGAVFPEGAVVPEGAGVPEGAVFPEGAVVPEGGAGVPEGAIIPDPEGAAPEEALPEGALLGGAVPKAVADGVADGGGQFSVAVAGPGTSTSILVQDGSAVGAPAASSSDSGVGVVAAAVRGALLLEEVGEVGRAAAAGAESRRSDHGRGDIVSVVGSSSRGPKEEHLFPPSEGSGGARPPPPQDALLPSAGVHPVVHPITASNHPTVVHPITASNLAAVVHPITESNLTASNLASNIAASPPQSPLFGAGSSACSSAGDDWETCSNFSSFSSFSEVDSFPNFEDFLNIDENQTLLEQLYPADKEFLAQMVCKEEDELTGKARALVLRWTLPSSSDELVVPPELAGKAIAGRVHFKRKDEQGNRIWPKSATLKKRRWYRVARMDGMRDNHPRDANKYLCVRMLLPAVPVPGPEAFPVVAPVTGGGTGALAGNGSSVEGQGG